MNENIKTIDINANTPTITGFVDILRSVGVEGDIVCLRDGSTECDENYLSESIKSNPFTLQFFYV